ncbi:hypothetical protein D3C75_704570 [compost metagenome]
MHLNRGFSGSGFEHCTANADNIPQIKNGKRSILRFGNTVLTDIDLYLSTEILNMRKAGFTHYTLSHNTASNADFEIKLIQFLFGLPIILGDNIPGTCRTLIFLAKWIDSQRTKLVQFAAADGQKLTKLFFRILRSVHFLGHVFHPLLLTLSTTQEETVPSLCKRTARSRTNRSCMCL